MEKLALFGSPGSRHAVRGISPKSWAGRKRGLEKDAKRTLAVPVFPLPIAGFDPAFSTGRSKYLNYVFICLGFLP